MQRQAQVISFKLVISQLTLFGLLIATPKDLCSSRILQAVLQGMNMAQVQQL